MTPRHIGKRLSISTFAERAGVSPRTLEAYVQRGQPAYAPVPPPCWPRGEQGQRQWCEKHADAWINRPGRRPRKAGTGQSETKPPKEQS